jgi:ubiquitin-activating enzyme E1 C
MVKGVIKNIIPAIASTQAIVASMCTTEAIKFITDSAPCIDNNVILNGNNGTYFFKFSIQKKKDCLVCSPYVKIKRVPGETVQQFIERLDKDYNYPKAKLFNSETKEYIYSLLKKDSVNNLPKPIEYFIPDSDTVIQLIYGNPAKTLLIILE